MLILSSALPRRILIVLAVLVLFGQIILFSATAVLGIQRQGSEFFYVTRQAIGLGVGVLALVVGLSFPLKYWMKAAYALIIVQIGLTALTFVPGIGLATKLGASRWIRLGPLTFQPSELAKLVVAVYLAASLSAAQQGRWTLQRWALQLSPVALLLALILKQPDLGATVLLGSLVLGLLFVAGLKARYLLWTGLVALATIAFAISTSPYRMKRFLAYVNPWSDPLGSGFQSIQSYLSFHSGKLFGVGLGNGNSKLFFLPDVHTDFIYSLVGEELGFLGSAALLLTFLYLILLLFRLSSQCETHFSRFLSFGLAFSLALQISINLSGVIGLIPMKGLPLPFLSWGRSALIVNLTMMGILMRCYIEKSSEVIGTSPAPR